MAPLPPPPAPTASGPTQGECTAPPRTWRTWQLAATAGIALLLGLGMGGSADGGETETVAPAGVATEDLAELEAQVAELEAALASRDDALAAAGAELDDLRAAPEPEPEPEPEPASELSTSQRNARSAAQNYLGMMPFSRSGLIEQLEFEGYSRAQAEHGVAQTGL